MFRKLLGRGGMTLALVLVLTLVGAAPATAGEIGARTAWGWLASLFDLSWIGLGAAEDPAAGNNAGLIRVWEMEGAGFDPNGDPVQATGPTFQEGAGFDPNGG